MSLTFKQYLDSKDQLLKAMERTPISIVEYEVCKYCSIPIAEEGMETVSLRPKNTIIVEWLYKDIHNPIPTSVRFKGVKGISEQEQYSLNIPRIKLQKFIDRHTKG
jgi:hypothetical protein